MQRIFLSVVN